MAMPSPSKVRWSRRPRPRRWDGPVTAFAAEIDRLPLLTAAREAELGHILRDWRVARVADPDLPAPPARAELIRANLRLVLMVARSCRRAGVAFEEIVGWGNVGLCEAADRFDPDRGRFSTIAVYWIRLRCRHAHREATTVVLPRQVHEAIAAERRGGPRHRLVDAADRVAEPTLARLDHHDADGIPVRDLIPGRPGDGPGAVDWRDALGALPPAEADLIARRLGLGGEPETFRALGRSLGVDRDAASGRYRAAVARLAAVVGEAAPGRGSPPEAEGLPDDRRAEDAGVGR